MHTVLAIPCSRCYFCGLVTSFFVLQHARAPWSGFAIVSLCRRTSNQPEGIAVALSPEA
ncbi:hypothetical protein BDP27DRAFT_1408805 [Rhodocollybia butyracea]|uniref:Uncharacterized protein n=1 Tax=Rhodocollybia butyracea TaxID=206335 RepID=A0A9P5TY06_9AGAR|nr:hypothetical protein BDP27DRAFT_1408805 [Rhodocollybia butyracea]